MKEFSKTFIDKPLPAFNKNNIPIIFCCDDNYVKYLSVAIQSIISNSSQNNNYDVIVLYTEISEMNKKMIASQILHHSNFSCRFINVGSCISKFDLKGKKHISKETFYRLLIIDIFEFYQKAIYLDSDLVVDDNIANLFNVDISEYFLAACRDIIGIGLSHIPFNYARRHQYRVLHLNNYHNYFNAGVLLMNLSLMRKNFTSIYMLNMVKRNEFRWMDQDVLNVLCERKTILLDDKWNMTNYKKHYKEAKHTPKNIYNKWKQSARSPSIYHFAGPKNFKPWFNPFDGVAYTFWKYAYKSPFYKAIVDNMISQTKSKRKQQKKLDKINEYINIARKKDKIS